MSKALEHLAVRVATDPLFLANALAEYARSESLDDAGLTAKLGCPLDSLTPLRLCGSPRPEQFLADVAAIADRFGIDRNTLAGIVRRGQSLAKLRATRVTEGQPGFLLAARDDEPQPPPQEESSP